MWPQSSITSSRAPGMPRASSSSHSTGMIPSSRPAITSVGQRIAPRYGRLSMRPMIARCWRWNASSSGRERHPAHLADEAHLAQVLRREELRRELGHDARKIGLRERHQPPPVRGGLGGVGAGVGIEEREALDAFRRAPQDLERHVSAHRVSREGEALGRRLRERILGEPGDRVRARELGRAAGCDAGQPGELGLEGVRVLEESGKEDQGRRRHGLWSLSRAESCGTPMLPQCARSPVGEGRGATRPSPRTKAAC